MKFLRELSEALLWAIAVIAFTLGLGTSVYLILLALS